MEDRNRQDLFLPVSVPARVMSLKVEVGSRIRTGTLVATYSLLDPATSGQDELCLRASVTGRVSSIFCKERATIQPNEPVCNVEVRCDHSIVVFDMCADCGQDLRRRSSSSEHFAQPESEVRVIHGMPELRVSQKEAEALGKKDYLRLLNSRKLALIVDLDQTLVHTSMDPNIEPGLPDVYGFHLPDHQLLYHCRLRPFTREFLARVAKMYELHVFTMGTKTYAASVTNILDPEHRFFSDRIISRDECFDPHSKALRLKSLFPCGDSLVAIIDDREDVWGRSPNLIHVKPYLFFAGTADINAPSFSHRSRRHQRRPQPHHRQGGMKGYSLSNPLPFKTRHVVRQPVQTVGTKRHSVEGRIPESAAEPCKRDEVEVTQKDSEDSAEKGSELISGTHEDKGEGKEADTEMGGVSMVSNDGGDSGIVECADLGQSLGADGSAGSDNKQGYQRDQGQADGGGVGQEGGRVDEVNVPEGTGDMSVEEHGDDTRNDESPPSTDTGQTVQISSSSILDHSNSSSSSSNGSSINNNNNNNNSSNKNNNNNNNLTGDGTSKKDKGSDSDSSSDSSDSSSSSGIDDSLFDMTAHEGGDEGEGGNEGEGGDEREGGNVASILTAGQNGITETSKGNLTSTIAGTRSSGVHVKTASGVGMPYTTSSADGKPGVPSQASRPMVEIKDPDTFLLQLADILERVHTIFYEQYDNTAATEKEYVIPDLKQIIPELRQSILKECRVLFTGVIPTNAPPRRNAEWRTARAFGATIHTELVPGLDSSNEEDVTRATTHVIAGKPGTTKLQEANKLPGIKVVTPRWLWACAEQWKKVDEAEYPLDLPPKGKKRRSDRGNGPPCKKKSVSETAASESHPDTNEKTGEVASIEGLRRSLDESVDPGLPLPNEEEDSSSDSCNSDDDDIFKNSAALNTLAKMDTTELKRHLSMESRLSVSDEELVRMDAEVEAEISESSSSSSNDGEEEGLGSQVEVLDNNEELSYENFAGTDDSDNLDSVMQGRKKRKFEDMEGSSSSEGEVPVLDSLLNESLISDEDFGASKSGEEDEDELSKLLGF